MPNFASYPENHFPLTFLHKPDVRTGKLISQDYQIWSTETVQFFDYLCINFDFFVFCKQQGKCAELVYCQYLRGNEKWIF